MRERLIERLRARPGESAASLARDLRVDETTVSYHLRRLARDGLVAGQDVGRERAWFATGTTAAGCSFCPVLRRLIPLMRRDAVRAVAGTLEDEPLTVVAVAREARLDAAVARRATAALASAGLVRKTAHGRGVSLAPGAPTCLARADARAPCDAWGACPVSRAWEERWDAQR